MRAVQRATDNVIREKGKSKRGERGWSVCYTVYGQQGTRYYSQLEVPCEGSSDSFPRQREVQGPSWVGSFHSFALDSELCVVAPAR